MPYYCGPMRRVYILIGISFLILLIGASYAFNRMS
jgi:hypothetical protein